MHFEKSYLFGFFHVFSLGYFLLFIVSSIPSCNGSSSGLKIDSYGFYRTVNNCPKSWTRVGTSCILLKNDDLLSWRQAREECQLQSGDLLVIDSPQKQDWLLKESVLAETDGWWLGLVFNRKWNWLTGQTVNETITPWSHEPTSGEIGDEEDCAAIYSNGNFTDKNCNLKYGYICKYTMKLKSDFCPSDVGWKQIDNSCYYVSDVLLKSKRLTWPDARTKCRSLKPELNSDLLSVSSLEEMSFIKSNAMSELVGAIPWWTGLNDKKMEGYFVWANGSDVDKNLITWDEAPGPNQKKTRNCAVMHTGGFIRDQNCEARAYYICEMKATREYLDLGCGSSQWIRASRNCYYFAKYRTVTWSEARDTCKRWNSQLLDVNTRDEKFWIEWQSYKLGSSGWWTGLNRKMNSWQWVNGKPANQSLIRWNQEPDNHNEDEDCTQITNDGTFIDTNCVRKAAYICQFYVEKGVPCPSKPKKWIRHKNYCYFFSSAVDPHDLRTWFEVPTRCTELDPSVQDNFGTRLTIHNKEEKEWLEDQLASLSKTSATWWTGLNDRNVEGVWRWNDDSVAPDMSLITWDGQPDNKNGDENCAAIFYEGRYADLNCDTPTSFICKKPLTGSGSRIKSYLFSYLLIPVMAINKITFYL